MCTQSAEAQTVQQFQGWYTSCDPRVLHCSKTREDGLNVRCFVIAPTFLGLGSRPWITRPWITLKGCSPGQVLRQHRCACCRAHPSAPVPHLVLRPVVQSAQTTSRSCPAARSTLWAATPSSTVSSCARTSCTPAVRLPPRLFTSCCTRMMTAEQGRLG